MQVSARLALPVTLALVSGILMTGCDEAPEMIAPASAKSLDVELNDPAYYVHLGTEFRLSQRLDDAIAAYRKAIQIDLTSVEAYKGLGQTLYQQKKFPQAIAAYRRALQNDPHSAEAYHGLGNVLLDQKRPEEAIAAYRRAVQSDSKFTAAYSGLGNALAARKKLADASAAYQKALALPDMEGTIASAHTLAFVGLGQIAQHQDDPETAIAAYEKAIELNADYAWTYLHLGKALYGKKQFKEATTAFRQVLDLPSVKSPSGSSHAQAHNGLGLVLQRQGKVEPAISAYQQALQLDLTCEEAGVNLKRAKQLLAQKPQSQPTSRAKFQKPLVDVNQVSWLLLLRSLDQVERRS